MSTEESDFTAALAWRVYRTCKHSGQASLSALANDLSSLYIGLKEAAECAKYGGSSQNDAIRELCIGAHEALNDVDGLIKTNASEGLLGQNRSSAPGYGLDGGRSKISRQVRVVNEYVDGYRQTNQRKLQEKLDRLSAELRTGVREDSVVSTIALAGRAGVASLDEAEIWKQLCQELSDFGVEEQAIASHSDVVKEWFKKSVAEKEARELERQQTEVNGAAPSYEDAISGGANGSASPTSFLQAPPAFSGSSLSPRPSNSNLSVHRSSLTPSIHSNGGSDLSPSISHTEAGPSDAPPGYTTASSHSGPKIESKKKKHAKFSKLFGRHASKMYDAIKADDLDAAKEIVEAGTLDIAEDKDSIGQTYLIRACNEEAEQVAEFLIPYSDLDAKDMMGKTALIFACRKSLSANLISKLVLNGANVNHTTYDTSPLSAAIQSQDLVVFKTLLQYGADPNKIFDRRRGLAPLHLAVTRFFTPDLLMDMLAVGAEIDIRDDSGNSPLHLAAGSGFASIIVELVVRGAEVQCVNNAMHTPIHCAVFGLDAARFCKSQFAERKTKVDWGAVIETLVQAGVDIHATDAKLNTALHWAARLWRADCVKVLLQLGAKLRAINAKGKTAYDLAKKGEDDMREVNIARTNGDRSKTMFYLAQEVNRLA